MAKANFQNKSKGAFTLIEILVVLVIMGFLVAMVAPKLAGVVDHSVDTTSDMSLKRFSTAINEVATSGSLPPALTNLVESTVIGFLEGGPFVEGGGAGPKSVDRTGDVIAQETDNNVLTGIEPMSNSFYDRMLPMKHVLVESEAKELRAIMGPAALTLKTTDTADGNKSVAYSRQFMGERATVMMIGMGATGLAIDGTEWAYATSPRVSVTRSTVTVDMLPANFESVIADAGDGVTAGGPTSGSTYHTAPKQYARIAEAKNLGRIVMGISNRNMLVVKGYLDESGISAKQMNNKDDFSYGNYVIILPRLAATVTRALRDADLVASGVYNGAAGAEDLTFQAIKYDENDNGSLELSARTPHSPSMGMSGGKLGGQALSTVTVADPTGHNIGERGGWFGVKLTKGTGKDLDGTIF